MNRIFTSFGIPFFVAGVVVSVGLAWPSQAIAQETTYVRLIAVEAGRADLLSQDLPVSLVSTPTEKAIRNFSDYCGDQPVSESAGAAVILGNLVEAGINRALDHLGARLQASLEAYSLSYQAGVWRRVGKNGPDFRCLRFVRGRENNGMVTVDMDLVLKVSLLHQGDALALEPLRLYYARPAPAKNSADGRYGLAFGLSAIALTRDKNPMLFDEALLTENLNADQLPITRYYGDLTPRPVSATTYVLAPTISSGQLAVGPLTYLKLSGVETGAPPRFLKVMNRLYGDNRSVIGDALVGKSLEKLAVLLEKVK